MIFKFTKFKDKKNKKKKGIKYHTFLPHLLKIFFIFFNNSIFKK